MSVAITPLVSSRDRPPRLRPNLRAGDARVAAALGPPACRPTRTALGELVALRKRLWDSGGELVLCNLNDRTYEALQVARLTGLLGIRERGGSRG